MKAALILLVSSATLLRVQAASEPLVIPSASDVIAHLIERDAERQAALSGYTATRRYKLDNKIRHASMALHLTSDPGGSKKLGILHESRSGTLPKPTFHKILQN